MKRFNVFIEYNFDEDSYGIERDEHKNGEYVDADEAEKLLVELQQRLAEAEELKADFKKAMKLFEDTGLDNLLWELLDTITKGE